MPVIVVDIDYTISNDKPLLEKLASDYGLSYNQLFEYWISQPREKVHELIRKFHEILYEMELEPFSHAVEALHRMKKLGYEIVYLTARPRIFNTRYGEINIEEITRKWIDKYGFPSGRLFISNGEKAMLFKTKALEEIAKARPPLYGIGDRKSDIFSYRSHGITPILFHEKVHEEYYHGMEFVEGVIHMERWDQLEELIRLHPFIERVVVFEKNGKRLELPMSEPFSSLVEKAKTVMKGKLLIREIRDREIMAGLVREETIIEVN